jgi:hypothetical protein
MNFFFGFSSRGGAHDPESFEAARRRIRGRMTPASDRDIQELIVPSATISCCALGDGGAILGSTSRDGHFLAYLGTFPNRLPDWRFAHSPRDRPQETADWLLQRYLEVGDAFLDRLPGHYALALGNTADDELLLATDGEGYRRLFVYKGEGSQPVVFASRLGLFRDLLGDSFAFDRSLEDFLLGYEFLPGTRTFYRGVEALAPGTLYRWTRGKLHTRAIEPAAPLEHEDLTGHSEDEIAEALYRSLLQAVEDQAAAEPRVAVLLGGFDSALVAALYQRLGKRVETFSFSFAEPGYDQPLVEEVAQHLGLRHHWVRMTPEILHQGLERFADSFDQPASQPHYLIQTAHACDAARAEGLLHCATGDGCDGLFLGYPTVYRRARLIEALSSTPQWTLGLGQWLLRPAVLERFLGHPLRLARNVLNILRRPMPARGHIASRIFDEASLAHLRQGAPPPQAEGVEEILEQLAAGLEGMSAVRLAYRGKGLVGLNKSKLAGSADQSGLTLQTPFAHPAVSGLASRLPESLSRPDPKAGRSGTATRNATGKHILMKMAEERGLLPREIIRQPKRSPVHAPVDRWYQGPLRPFVFEHLEGLPFDWSRSYVQGLLRPKISETLYRRHISLGDLALHPIALLCSYASFSGQRES